MKGLELDEDDGSVQAVHVVSTTNSNTNTTSSRIINDTDATVLATGHSARDVYESLYDCGVELEPKVSNMCSLEDVMFICGIIICLPSHNTTFRASPWAFV